MANELLEWWHGTITEERHDDEARAAAMNEYLKRWKVLQQNDKVKPRLNRARGGTPEEPIE